MLWTLLKILVFVALVGALAFGAEFLIASSDYIRIVLLGTEYTLPPLIAVISLAVLLLGMWLLLKVAGLLVALLRFINGDETALSRYFDRNREKRGYEALSDGMMALASGDHRAAISKAKKAERLMRRPDLTTLLTAQAAEGAGDTLTAETAYKRLLQEDSTRLVGVRGLLSQQLAAGQTNKAMKLAEKAFALKPRHTETQDVLLKLQAQDENWVGARQTLTAKLKSGSLPKDVHKRRSAVLALASARDALAHGKTDIARAESLEANRMSPHLVHAAVMAARMHIDSGNARAATKVLKAAWKSQPHPDLAAAFAQIDADETPQARIKRFGPLLKLMPGHAETKLLEAELQIAAEDFAAARRAMGDIADTQPTTRALSLMAAIERGEGADDVVVRGWLARALTVSRGPQWCCDACGNVQGVWGPLCDECGSFDTLAWTEPKTSGDAPALNTVMLPLIVGALENKAADEPEVVDSPEPEDAVVEGEATAVQEPEPATSR